MAYVFQLVANVIEQSFITLALVLLQGVHECSGHGTVEEPADVDLSSSNPQCVSNLVSEYPCLACLRFLTVLCSGEHDHIGRCDFFPTGDSVRFLLGLCIALRMNDCVNC